MPQPTHVPPADLAALRQLRSDAQLAQQKVEIHMLQIGLKYQIPLGGSWQEDGRISRPPSDEEVAKMGLEPHAAPAAPPAEETPAS